MEKLINEMAGQLKLVSFEIKHAENEMELKTAINKKTTLLFSFANLLRSIDYNVKTVGDLCKLLKVEL